MRKSRPLTPTGYSSTVGLAPGQVRAQDRHSQSERNRLRRIKKGGQRCNEAQRKASSSLWWFSGSGCEMCRGERRMKICEFVSQGKKKGSAILPVCSPSLSPFPAGHAPWRRRRRRRRSGDATPVSQCRSHLFSVAAQTGSSWDPFVPL